MLNMKDTIFSQGENPAVEILVFRYYALAICTSKFTRVMVR